VAMVAVMAPRRVSPELLSWVMILMSLKSGSGFALRTGIRG
jgi:hypothetical protein